MKKLLVSIVVMVGMIGVAPKITEAVPSYAKNLGVDCSACHTIWPQLNAFGRDFLTKLGEPLNQKKFGDMSLSDAPISVRLNLRLFDKEIAKGGDGPLKERSLHEGEVFLAGRSSKLFYFVEFESEDEWGEWVGPKKDPSDPDSDHAWKESDRPGFDFRLAAGFTGYQFMEEFNILAGYASPFAFDANDTVHHHKVLRRQWSATSVTPSDSQMISVAGKVADTATYILAFHSDDGNLEGVDPKSISVRATYDFLGQTVGGYYTNGQRYNETTEKSDKDYTLWGVDARLDIQGVNVMMLYGVRDNQGEVQLDNFSIEANRTFGQFTPIINIDTYKDTDRTTEGSFAVAYAWKPNMRLTASVEGTIDAPTPNPEDRRFVLYGDVGF